MQLLKRLQFLLRIHLPASLPSSICQHLVAYDTQEWTGPMEDPPKDRYAHLKALRKQPGYVPPSFMKHSTFFPPNDPADPNKKS